MNGPSSTRAVRSVPTYYPSATVVSSGKESNSWLFYLGLVILIAAIAVIVYMVVRALTRKSKPVTEKGLPSTNSAAAAAAATVASHNSSHLTSNSQHRNGISQNNPDSSQYVISQLQKHSQKPGSVVESLPVQRTNQQMNPGLFSQSKTMQQQAGDTNIWRAYDPTTLKKSATHHTPASVQGNNDNVSGLLSAGLEAEGMAVTSQGTPVSQPLLFTDPATIPSAQSYLQYQFLDPNDELEARKYLPPSLLAGIVDARSVNNQSISTMGALRGRSFNLDFEMWNQATGVQPGNAVKLNMPFNNTTTGPEDYGNMFGVTRINQLPAFANNEVQVLQQQRLLPPGNPSSFLHP